MAWISFRFLDLGAAVTNGLFIDLGPALDTVFNAVIPSSVSALSNILPVLVEGFMGILLLIFFPLHWALWYRPDQVTFAIAIILPWILVGTITAALFVRKGKQGFDTGLSVGIGYAIVAIVFPLILQALIGSLGGVSINLFSILNGVFGGFTDLPYIAAVLTACLEGGFIGGIFGAFIGSLKYDPNRIEKKGKKSKKSKKAIAEPVFATPTFGATMNSRSDVPSTSSNENIFCPNCGTKVVPGDPFCPNCGSKV